MTPPRARRTFPFPAAGGAAPTPARPAGQALRDDSVIGDLLARHAQSQARLAVVSAHLPQAMRAHVRAGPLDERKWVLLAASSAVAAKLLHLVPALGDALRAAGWPPCEIRVRVRRSR